MIRKIAICFFILIGCLCQSQAQARPLIEIIDLKWCSEIKEREPTGIYENGSNFKGEKLYLWMKVKGYQETLDRLRQGKKIGIIQRWNYQYLGWKTEDIDISIGKEKQLSHEIIQKLQQEVDQRGYFDWRTWGYKRNLKSNRYTLNDLDFVDVFYDPLSCEVEQNCKMNIQWKGYER